MTEDRVTPKRLRALSHPLRWTLLELVSTEGSVTATRCAEVTGESVASCSYHLNMLAKYDFITEADGGHGREKPWRLTSYHQEFSAEGLDDEQAMAAEAAGEAFYEFEFARLREWERRKSREPKPWRMATGTTGVTTFLTIEETEEVTRLLEEIATRHADRLEHRDRIPAGARPVRLFVATSLGLGGKTDDGGNR